MTQQILYIPLIELRAHEKTSKKRLLEVIADIKRCGVLNNPIIVSRQGKVVLDGHHRLAALKYLGAKTAPVMMVDYFSNQISIGLRRPELRASLIKTAIISFALQGKVLPHKTTKHSLPHRILNQRIRLSELL